MKMRNSMRGFAAAAMLGLACAPATPGLAQDAAGKSDVIKVPCCRCLDGSQQKVSLDTRTAPWRVASGSGPAAPVVNATPDPGWSSLAPAGWVKGASTAAGTHTYTLTIVVPRCVIGARVSIKGQFGADNSGVLFLDNSQISATSGGINGFKAPNFGSFSNLVTPGTHTLRLVVKNEGGPTGMILAGAVTTECPKSTELSAAGSAAGTQVASACGCDRKQS